MPWRERRKMDPDYKWESNQAMYEQEQIERRIQEEADLRAEYKETEAEAEVEEILKDF